MTEPGNTKSGPSASQQLANELAGVASVEQQTAHAARIAAPSANKRQRTVAMSLAVALPLLFFVLAAEFAWVPLMSLFETEPPPAVAGQQAREILDGLVSGIEGFRKDYKTLPRTLVEIGMPARGQWTYVVAGPAHYTISGRLYGQSVNFDSGTAPATPAARQP